MILVSDYININNEELILKLKDYIKTNKCCTNFPNCFHPEYQTDNNIFNLKDPNIEIIKEVYFNFIINNLKNKSLKVIHHDCWAYINYKGQKPNNGWHDHHHEKGKINITGLMYLTETYFGTEFKTKFLKIETIPYINRWYLWDSEIFHKPIDNIATEDRVVLATNTILMENV